MVLLDGPASVGARSGRAPAYEQIQELPQESLPELARYIEFLRFKTRTSTAMRPTSPVRIVKLRGLLKGYDFSSARVN